ncbi:MAG: glycosyltransferase [Flavobacteriaceae bacterium]|nr:glycosyltransferase [Bacteroidia bacterium]NNL15774.1 glycosyltransferase [Flavobacteriaceae bacterium]
MELSISFIIPVFNRPNEIHELLQSFTNLRSSSPYEIVIVEDGSSITCKEIVVKFSSELNIRYLFKENSGPGDSRNFGMNQAKGNYFIILDSDCILPPDYLEAVLESLNTSYTDCFGGPDSAHSSFSNLQKAINFSMTSFITTGGIRGRKKSVQRFEPRSFNMGISKKAFIKSGGFGNIHPGEDPDLSIRLKKLGYKTKLIPEAFVYHKRRISLPKFYSQVYKFGLVRPILNNWHPASRKISFWFPFLFSLGLVLSISAFLIGFSQFLWLFVGYFFMVFVVSLIKNKSIIVALISIITTILQFLGYGFGFIISTLNINIFNRKPEVIYPFLFFKIND